MHEEPDSARLRFAVLATTACLLLTLPRLLLHELWRDEAWLWQVVLESRSLAELFAPLGRSGQGYVFPLLCYLVRHVSTSPRAMQGLHLLLAAAAAFVFARWAPFRRRERGLFLLGYFPFYEYAVISRHYVAGALLVWLACAAAGSRMASWTASRWPALCLGAALGLLCQTTVYGYILALALAAGWLFDRQRRRSAAGFALALAGGAAGLAQLIPKSGTSYAAGWRLAWNPAKATEVLALPWHAFVPLPRPGLHFWNTNLLDAWPVLQAAAGLLMLALAAALLWRRKVALATFLAGSAGLLVFAYVKFIGVQRHQGHLWLLFVAALWLGSGFQNDQGDPDDPNDRRSWRGRVFLVLLVLHCAAGAYASWMDLRHPFSNGAATAQLLRSEGLDRYPLLGHQEPAAATVAFFLGQPIYAPSRGLFVTYPDWGPDERELSNPELRCAARTLARREGRDIVLVINRDLPPWAELDPAGSRRGAIVRSEDYSLYLLRRDRLDATAPAAGCQGEAP